ncbi:phospholipase A and acyltransferase 2-like [Tachypleus tridentatus]|uniref:phospholipase A and acyltransferase 2-like n=1 Tax=Tachypleus tridentatus TaxID=6853 RepID=UPI003FD05453
MPHKKTKNFKKLCINTERFGLTAFLPAGSLKNIEVGDIIEIDRIVYAHWALYVGDGSVVHVCGPNNEDFVPNDHAVVKIARLEQVAGFNGVRINNKVVPAKDRGLKCLLPNQVIKRAFENLNKEVPYNFLSRNCEHYVTEWKYGIGWSDQASVTINVMKSLSKDYDAHQNHLMNSLTKLLNSPTVSSSKLSTSPSVKEDSMIPEFSKKLNKLWSINSSRQ